MPGHMLLPCLRGECRACASGDDSSETQDDSDCKAEMPAPEEGSGHDKGHRGWRQRMCGRVQAAAQGRVGACLAVAGTLVLVAGMAVRAGRHSNRCR